MWRIVRYEPNSKSRYLVLAIAIILLSIACSQSLQSEGDGSSTSPSNSTELNIWWEKGFELREDEAIRVVVNRWQATTGNKVKLSFYTTNELLEKARRAVQARNPPDLIMNQTADRTLYPDLAWQGKLEDVSDIIEPVKDDYPKHILQAITYQNKLIDRRSYYGVPIHQATIFIFYWQNLLAEIGLSAKDIPQDWDGFWQFWQRSQLDWKIQKNRDIYGLGLPVSGTRGTDDLYHLFEQILEAYNVTLVSPQGELLVRQAEVRQGIIQCLDWYSQFYQQGYVPPDALTWLNTDNNRNLLNRVVLMTPNTTFSIPAAVSLDRDTYFNQLGILEFPRQPNGKEMRYLVSVRQAAIFTDSMHKQQAKDFLRYFIQPQVTKQYLQASGNRTLPVQNSVWQDSYWQQTTDPYLAKATKILTQGKMRLHYVVDNPAYSQVLQENVWGKALHRIIVDRLTPEQAADEAIERIEKIFAQLK